VITEIVPESPTARQLTLRLLDQLFGSKLPQGVGVRLWDKSYWPHEGQFDLTLVLNHPGALRAMLLPGTEVALAEAYLYNDFDLEGNLEEIFELDDTLRQVTLGWHRKLYHLNELRHLPDLKNERIGGRPPARLKGQPHSLERDREAVTYHYNVSTDFYRLWLDRQMVYSCAYYHNDREDLDTAQTNKLDYICRKLRLRPGQKLLDLGCGWGSLALYAASHFGVDVTGITLSQPQADYANAQIALAGLSERARVQVKDYRELPEPESYDALVSVGMVEHVGHKMLPTYFKQAYRLLRSGGVFLNHGIATGLAQPEISGPGLIENYVFPDGELVPISTILHEAEQAGLEARDLESLREHYLLTLRQWVQRLEASHAEVLKIVDEPTYRIWRLYMAAAAYGFKTNQLSVYQTLLIKPGAAGQSYLPFTRQDWYI